MLNSNSLQAFISYLLKLIDSDFFSPLGCSDNKNTRILYSPSILGDKWINYTQCKNMCNIGLAIFLHRIGGDIRWYMYVASYTAE